jgi:hypothetical protein
MSSVGHEGHIPYEKASASDISFHPPASHQSAESSPTFDAGTISRRQHSLNLTRTKSIAETLSPLREFLFVGLFCSTQFVTQAGLLNTLNILHIIGSDLGIISPGVLSWPWTFWTFGITLALLAVLSTFVLPSVPLSTEVRVLTHREKIAELDIVGASIGITAMVLFNFPWNQAPGFGWSNVYINFLLIAGILLLPVFFWYELRVTRNPLLPFDALSTDVSFLLVCESCGWAAFGE